MNILRNNIINIFLNKTAKYFHKNCQAVKTTANKNLPGSLTYSVLYCDGGFNNLTKPYAWSSVVDINGVDVITNNLNLINKLLKNNFEYQQVNIPHLITKKIYNRTIIKIKFTNIYQQNNGAELIAMLVSLYLANTFNNINIIYCDSQTIINWCQGKINLKSGQKDKNNNDKLYYINLLQTQYNIFIKNNNKIIKINGNDNLADLGKHK